MAVEVSPLNALGSGTAPPPTSFSDTLGVGPSSPRNTFGAPSDSWIPVLLGGDLPFTAPMLPSYVFGAALGGGGGSGLIISANPFVGGATYSMAGGIIPRTMYVGSPFYSALQKFVQITFNSAASISSGIGIFNWLDLTGTGSTGSAQVNHDCYFVDQGGGGAGVPGLIRFNSGPNKVILNAGTGTLQQGDVLRVGFDFTNPAQVSILVSTNGVLRYTQIDNSASRMTSAGSMPFIGAYSLAAASSGQYKNFSCGVGL